MLFLERVLRRSCADRDATPLGLIAALVGTQGSGTLGLIAGSRWDPARGMLTFTECRGSLRDPNGLPNGLDRGAIHDTPNKALAGDESRSSADL